MKLAASAAVILLCSACGGDDEEGGGPDVDECTLEAAGELVGERPCEDLTLIYNQTEDHFTFTANNDEEPTLVIIGSFQGPGRPEVGSYSDAMPEVRCGIGAQDTGVAWNASRTDSDVPWGSCSMTFDDVAAGVSAGPITLYSGSGTVTATLDPVTTSGASGTVTVTIPFTIAASD